ncbi:MAG: shikimate dehydrogenase [Vagococcus sp.]|uniref:shikimate dehydrogenase n=1 Tax=Vagococcus sp. TaxID=1933889 RepID=UPI002FCA10A7
MEKLISGYTKLAGVIAKPIKHSLSPLIHNTGYRALTIDAVYLAFEVEETEFDQALDAVKTFDMLGVNLSMPYKQKGYDRCDTLSESAKLIGVVNTIVQRNGQFHGYNTDGIGFIESLIDEGISINNQTLTILGAGGAAKAVICQCALDGIKEINVFKRNNHSFNHVQKELADISTQTNTVINVFDYADKKLMEDIISKSDILVNATQIGMGDNFDLPIGDNVKLTEQHVVVDLIYHPLETPLLKLARANDAVVINGLGMLVHQAAYAFELMTQEKMPIKIISERLIEELNDKERE